MPLYTLLTNQRLRKSPKDFNYENKRRTSSEYCEYTVNTMDEETLKQIAQITLLANINPETPMQHGKMHVAQMNQSLQTEDLLELIKTIHDVEDKK